MLRRSLPFPLLLWAFAVVIFLSACTPHRAVVDKYRYLIKEEENVATKETPEKEVVEEKAVLPHVGEKLMPVLEEASTYLGTPYRHGGSTKAGIDCSGLTMNCYYKAGLKLPRSAAEQSQYGEHIERKDLIIGDLVFFDAKGSGKIDHVGMVTRAEGKEVVFIHSSTSKGVRFDFLNEGFWEDKLREARRIPLE